jgi:hypothetical protein
LERPRWHDAATLSGTLKWRVVLAALAGQFFIFWLNIATAIPEAEIAVEAKAATDRKVGQHPPPIA